MSALDSVLDEARGPGLASSSIFLRVHRPFVMILDPTLADNMAWIWQSQGMGKSFRRKGSGYEE
jgi:hypothetical protein